MNVADFGFDKNGWTGTGTTGKSKGRMTDKWVKSISSKTWKELFEYAKVPFMAVSAVALTALIAYLVANDATGIGVLDDFLIGPAGAALSQLLLKLGDMFGKNPQFASAMSCSLA